MLHPFKEGKLAASQTARDRSAAFSAFIFNWPLKKIPAGGQAASFCFSFSFFGATGYLAVRKKRTRNFRLSDAWK
jgi:hypothetical protein